MHDAIDIAHLEFAALKGCDSLYKMALWDVSQNVDRFKADLGIAPCLTPSGQDFASNRQHTLNGSQLLILQGMPLDRLLFANETEGPTKLSWQCYVNYSDRRLSNLCSYR